jgi:hypothetical protein
MYVHFPIKFHIKILNGTFKQGFTDPVWCIVWLYILFI